MKLEGIRVVDLSLFLPGPAMTQAMADHGAEVIKVEPPGGEPNRAIGLERDGVSVFFANTHRGKRSLVLDLKTAEGVEALLRLAESADVFVESFRPGVVDRLGVGYAGGQRAQPADRLRLDLGLWPERALPRPAGPRPRGRGDVGRALSVNLGWDDRPCSPAIAAADMLAASIALAGVLMALLRRERTGKGDYVDVAMLDSLIAAMPNNYGPPLAERRQPVAKDERSWGGNAHVPALRDQGRPLRRARRRRDQVREQPLDARSAGPTWSRSAGCRRAPGSSRCATSSSRRSGRRPGTSGSPGWPTRTSPSRR